MENRKYNPISELAIDYFMQTPAGEKLEQAIKALNKLQNDAAALYSKEGQWDVTAVKAVTVLTFTILEKLSDAKNIKNITPDSWKEIANTVTDYSVHLDDQSYSVYVFEMYEKFIRSGAVSGAEISPEKSAAISALADQLKDKTALLKEEKITETAYIEDCLWIALEAMIKLIASSMPFSDNPDNAIFDEFKWALANFALEFGRYTLYRKELELVNEFIDSQYYMDEQLHEKHDAFIAELEQQSKMFSDMIDNAFDPDFKESFINSIALAMSAGVDSSEILKTEEEIDDFFITDNKE